MFKCGKCSSSFTWKDNLLRHIKTHKGDRIPCELCASTFKYKSALKRHEKNVHMSEDDVMIADNIKLQFPKLTSHEDNFDSVLSDIVKTKEDIKHKYKLLKSGKADVQKFMTDTFKPIIEPLNKISVKQNNLNTENQNFKIPSNNKDCIIKNKSENSIPEELDEEQSLIQYYKEENDVDQLGINNWFNSANLDKTYGPKKHFNDRITIGNKEVEFNNNSLCIGESLYSLTPGIVRLLFNKNPSAYTEQDLETYKTVLVQTSAHLTRDSRIKIIGNKYKNIISKIFPSGKGLPVQLEGFNYHLWEDPNELVDRLRLLLSSQAAGNTGVSNEILAIFEELYEAGYIKRIPSV